MVGVPSISRDVFAVPAWGAGNERSPRTFFFDVARRYYQLKSTKKTQIDDNPQSRLLSIFSVQELRLDEFITHELGFQDINKAFDLLVQGKSIRCVVWMDR